MQTSTLADLPAAILSHGGNLAAARLRFPQATLPWIDLSTGVNPYSYPLGKISQSDWQRLPDTQAQRNLQHAAAAAYGVDDPQKIVVAPGTQALLQQLPHLLAARQIAVLTPTYSEYRKIWHGKAVEVIETHELSQLLSADVAFLAHPNNPDGHLFSQKDLQQLAAEFRRQNKTLIIDEAFIDLMPKACSLAHQADEHLFVLRSFGKTYGLAGLRLGFLIADRPTSERFQQDLGPWAVSGPALTLGARALADRVWLDKMRHRTGQKMASLRGSLQRADFRIIGGTPLFVLVEHPDALKRFDHLAHAGILTRPFTQHPQWLRIGLPGPLQHERRLIAELRQF